MPAKGIGDFASLLTKIYLAISVKFTVQYILKLCGMKIT